MTAQWQGSDLAAPFNYNDSPNVKTGLEGAVMCHSILP